MATVVIGRNTDNIIRNGQGHSLLLDGWQRCQSTDSIYYINHEHKKTQWNHPFFNKVFKELDQYTNVKYSVYRIALKIRHISNRLKLNQIDLDLLSRSFEDVVSRQISCNRLFHLLVRLFTKSSAACLRSAPHSGHHSAPHSGPHSTGLAQNPIAPDVNMDVKTTAEMTLNLLLNVHDIQREGAIDLVSVHVTLAILSNSPPLVKFQYVFRLMSLNANLRQITKSQMIKLLKIFHLLSDLVNEDSQVQSNQDSLVAMQNMSLPHIISDNSLVDEFCFLRWCTEVSSGLAWITVIQRFNLSSPVVHQSKCSYCKTFPILGMRYRCLRCFNYDLCQTCFLTIRDFSKHRDTHPVKECCSQCSVKDDFRTIVNVVRNKFTKKKLKGHRRTTDGSTQRRVDAAIVQLNNQDNLDTELDNETAISPIEDSTILVSKISDYQTRKLESIISKLEQENRFLRTELTDLKKKEEIIDEFTVSSPSERTILLPDTPTLTPSTSRAPSSSIVQVASPRYRLPADLFDNPDFISGTDWIENMRGQAEDEEEELQVRLRQQHQQQQQQDHDMNSFFRTGSLRDSRRRMQARYRRKRNDSLDSSFAGVPFSRGRDTFSLAGLAAGLANGGGGSTRPGSGASSASEEPVGGGGGGGRRGGGGGGTGRAEARGGANSVLGDRVNYATTAGDIDAEEAKGSVREARLAPSSSYVASGTSGTAGTGRGGRGIRDNLSIHPPATAAYSLLDIGQEVDSSRDYDDATTTITIQNGRQRHSPELTYDSPRYLASSTLSVDPSSCTDPSSSSCSEVDEEPHYPPAMTPRDRPRALLKPSDHQFASTPRLGQRELQRDHESPDLSAIGGDYFNAPATTTNGAAAANTISDDDEGEDDSRPVPLAVSDITAKCSLYIDETKSFSGVRDDSDLYLSHDLDIDDSIYDHDEDEVTFTGRNRCKRVPMAKHGEDDLESSV